MHYSKLTHVCGVAGIIGLSGVQASRTSISRMSAAIRHRGPDGEGIYLSWSVALAVRRLSILDVSSTGDQPMVSPNGNVILCFNGEIYNYLELRNELQSRGHVFQSSGDTEVLLHAYLEWGHDCLNRLNGMWAFLIYDRRQRKIFGSRDRFGKKPLYYYRSTHAILIASEIKAILASGSYAGGINWERTSELLLGKGLDHITEGTATFFSGIDQLPAGSAFDLDLDGAFKQWAYWTLPKNDIRENPINNPAELFYQTLQDACRVRMRSDVPVGILLSGGIDSTSVLCCLRTIYGESLCERVSAFSYQPEEYDESRYIHDSVRQTGVNLILLDPDSQRRWDSLEQMLWYQDEPVHSLGSLAAFELYRLASQHGVKVVLTGGGVDEFLGYPSVVKNYWCSLLKKGNVFGAWKEIAAYCSVRGGGRLSLLENSLLHLCKSELRRLSFYRELVTWKHRKEVRNDLWFTPDLGDYLRPQTPDYQDPSLDAELRRSVTCAPLPVYLRIDDRNSMAHSIEARAPFLDYRLVSLAFHLRPDWKVRGPWTKYLLREAMRHRIPTSIANRVEKWGFPVPSKKWFGVDFSDRVRDLLESQQIRERGIYKLDRIRKDYDLHRKGAIDISDKLFNIVQFELWSKTFASAA
jgi:asparagine synthase (glutamine-hydrolysing)